jgi:glycosyltransferase involved in cell wall biosynthesis
LSSVPRFLFKALSSRFPIVDCLDYSPQGVSRLTLAALTFRPSRHAWRGRFHTSLRANSTLSRHLAARLASVGSDFDLALQVFGWVRGQPKPYVLYVDQTRLMSERGFSRWLPLSRRERSRLLRLESEMYGEASHVFVMAGAAKDSLVGDYQVDPGRVTVVGGGINFETFPKHPGPAKDSRILFIGRDFKRKGGEVLLRAFERVRTRLPDAELHVVGTSERLTQPGVHVDSRQFFDDRRQISNLYADARVFCFPALYEPFGLVLPEAMAHGVPCIGSTVQAIPEILDGGRAGLLVPAGEPEPLADALLRLLTDDELAQRVGEAGRRRVKQRYTWEHVADQMAPILARVGSRAR